MIFPLTERIRKIISCCIGCKMFSKAYDISEQDKIFRLSRLFLTFLFFVFLFTGSYWGYRKAHRTLETNKTLQTVMRTALIVSGNPQRLTQIGPLPLQPIIKGATGNSYRLSSGVTLSVYIQADDKFMIHLQDVPYYICENIIKSEAIPSFAYEGGKNLEVSANPTLTELCGSRTHNRVSLGLLFNKHLTPVQQENLKVSLFNAFKRTSTTSQLFVP